ncbi:MAG TPA: transporter substrate-binding domain-containing protein [Armatimonadota bacterium]
MIRAEISPKTCFPATRTSVWAAWWLCALILLPLCGHTAPAATGQTVLRIGCGQSFPPYQMIDHGEPTGFDAEMIEAVARQIGYTPELHVGGLSALRQDLAAGRLDVIAGMSYLPARKSTFLFSTPICTVSYAVFIRDTAKIAGWRDLAGKTIAVQRGGAMADYLHGQGFSGATRTVDDGLQALRLLAAGRCDAAMLAEMPGLYYCTNYGLQHIVVLPDKVMTEPHGFALAPGNSALMLRLNDGLQRLRDNGQFREI